MSGRSRVDGKPMHPGAAFASRRVSPENGLTPADLAGTLRDEEAAIGGIGEAAPKGGTELAQSALVPISNHDVSVMPTVVEGQQGAVTRAAEAVEAVAETKTESEGAAMSKDLPDGSVAESTFSSIRFRGGTADAPPSPSPNPSSSGGANAAKGGSMRGSLTSESSGRGSMRAMFKKASHSFSSNSAMSRSHRGHHQRNTSDLQGLQRRMPARGKLTEADEAMLSDSEADYDAFDNDSERVGKKLFSPNFRFLRWYATFMLVALLTFVFYMPIRIAFFPSERGAWYGIDLAWHLVFAIDVLVHLNTGFVDGTNGKVVYSRMAICQRYAKGALIVDLLAAFPFTFIPGLGPGSADGNHEIAYLLSLPKMFQVYWLMTMVYENHRLHEGTFLAVRTLLCVVVTAHLFGCGWYMLATLLRTECEDLYFEGLPEGEVVFEYDVGDYIASECPWIYRNDYVALSVGRRYLGSVYWALTTLTTVGYGDLSARTPAEQIYSMAVQIVGVSWYGYIVGTWASILNSFDRKDKEQRSKMREVVAFSKAAGLPPEMAKKVRQHFRFALYRQDNWITFNEQELVSDMPAGLRADVITYVHASLIAEIPWLEGKDKNFVADVVVMLKPRLFMAGDMLYRRGSQPEEMFFIASGLVMLKYKQERVGFLRHGQMAGLIGLVSSEKHRITAVVAQKDAHCHGLSRANFMMLEESYPKEMEELRESAKSLTQRIALSCADAKEDFLSNDVLSAFVSKSKAFTGARPVGDRWTELQHESTGRGPESTVREPLPDGFLQQKRQQQQHLLQPQQQPHSAAVRNASIEPDDQSSSAATFPFSTPTSLSAGSLMANPGGGGGGDVGVGVDSAAIEDAVSREVSRRMLGVETRVGAVMGRLESFLDAAAAAAADSSTNE